jgi:hypothetical protein
VPTFEIIYRAASLDDLSAVAAIQEANLRSSLASSELHEGFISVAWNAKQFEQMIAADAIIVATVGGDVVGYYACVGLSGDPRAVEYLIEAREKGELAGTRLSELRIALGPQTCVRRAHRHSGIGIGLYLVMAQRLSDRFDVMLGSVHRQNIRATNFNFGVIGGHGVWEDDARRYVGFDIRPAARAAMAQRVGAIAPFPNHSRR